MEQYLAYTILGLFWVFGAFPTILSDGRESYRDMCFLSICINFMLLIFIALGFVILWAFSVVIS